MAKINTKNIALILGMTIFDIAIGFYDRFFDNVGVINWLVTMDATPTAFTHTNATYANITASGAILANSMSVFDLGTLFIFVIAAVFIISLTSGVLVRGGGMS